MGTTQTQADYQDQAGSGAFRATARTGPARQESPLAHLDEATAHDGAQWYAEGPRGALHLVRWFSKPGNVVAWKVTGMKTVHRGRAGSIEEARGEALRMAGLIAGGKRN